MEANSYITAFIQYGLDKKLIAPCDKSSVKNQLLETLQLESCSSADNRLMSLEQTLNGLTDIAVQRNILSDDLSNRDLFAAKLMGILTPPADEVRRKFAELYEQSPQAATEWYYRFSQDTDYIHRHRAQKDIRWKTATAYGNLDITINLSKPENVCSTAPASPHSCFLCSEIESYAGYTNQTVRQNLRSIPIMLAGEPWRFQYSPYAYYPEHCIVSNSQHVPMVVNKATFQKLLDFVAQFPHYFIGANADLPVVGSSNLTHEYFLGGCTSFPIERASIDREIAFKDYEDIKAGILKWPMSVIRLTGTNKDRLCDLATKILLHWRIYNDKATFIYAKTEGEPHNTVTPIARRRGERYELDLVLRSNLATVEHPLGVYHPHSELHHIKKENIGLMEVMGLAVLPGRLKEELGGIEASILNDTPLVGDLAKHKEWVENLLQKQMFTPQNTASILKMEVGKSFAQMLEQASVFKRTQKGSAAFDRFIEAVNHRS